MASVPWMFPICPTLSHWDFNIESPEINLTTVASPRFWWPSTKWNLAKHPIQVNWSHLLVWSTAYTAPFHQYVSPWRPLESLFLIMSVDLIISYYEQVTEEQVQCTFFSFVLHLVCVFPFSLGSCFPFRSLVVPRKYTSLLFFSRLLFSGIWILVDLLLLTTLPFSWKSGLTDYGISFFLYFLSFLRQTLTM